MLHRCPPARGKTESYHEEKLKSLEKARKPALEMAQEEDAPKKETAQNESEVDWLLDIVPWEHRVVRHPRGLQLPV